MAGRVALAKDLPRYGWLHDQMRALRQMDRDALVAVTQLLKVSQDLQAAIEANFAMYGLSQGRHTTLMLVAQFGRRGGSTPALLAAAAGVTRATMTGLLDGLERDRLIERRASTQDRRKVDIHITPAGTERLHSLQPDHARRLAAMLASLSAAEKRSLARLLGKIEGALGALTEPAPPRKVRRAARAKA
jgi:DNA-binding MarR family transcriptional regulator